MYVGTNASPQIPSDTPGKSGRLLRIPPNDAGFVELVRMKPRVAMPLRLYTKGIHADNLTGSRELCTGEVIGPGEYVYEPVVSQDWWRIVGHEVMIALAIVHGEVELLAADGSARSVVSAPTPRAELGRCCRAQGLPMPDRVG